MKVTNKAECNNKIIKKDMKIATFPFKKMYLHIFHFSKKKNGNNNRKGASVTFY